jgi:hypothetical protein
MLQELRKEMNRSGYVMRNSGERCAHSLNSNLHAAGFINLLQVFLRVRSDS